MTFKEIANRITGISFPIFGISWTPLKAEIEIAEKVITFLEDRRVLYNPYELEIPENCLESVIDIREFLTKQLFDLERDNELSNILRAMRSACRRFLDNTENVFYIDKMLRRNNSNLGSGGQMVFYSAVGELRGTMGFLIAKILILHGIDCESDLVSIIPLTTLEE